MVVVLCRHKLPTGDDPSAAAKLKTQLQRAEEKVRLFETKMKDAEEDAHVKAQEVSLREVSCRPQKIILICSEPFEFPVFMFRQQK